MAGKIATLLALGTLLVLSALNEAKSHSWYSPYCCSGKDCGPARVTINPNGTVTATNQFGTATFTQKQFRPSRDGQYHACIHPTLGPRCIYIPAGM